MNHDTKTMTETVQDIIALLKEPPATDDLLAQLDNYHENDIAQAFVQLTKKERIRLYRLLDAETVSDIFSYIEEPEPYIKELDIHNLAKIIEEMDADDAVDLIEEMDDTIRGRLHAILDQQTAADIDLICSYEDDEIGSLITTNYILIVNTLTIKEAMRELSRQAGENDNISTIYVKDKRGCFYGAIDLKDLILAREHEPLEKIISTSFPTLDDHAKIADCIERIKDYAEDSLPVLNEHHRLVGIITAQDVIELVDEEMGEDYARLAGLTSAEDLTEKTKDSVKKRLPWLCILLVLGVGVSSVVGLFEGIVAVIPLIVCFQSLILDMAGNVGTQSLGVTIRVLSDEHLSPKQLWSLIGKELRVGLLNGLLLGSATFLLVGLYLALLKHQPALSAFRLSSCVGVSLLVSMAISGMVGTLIPLFFHKIKVDPAVASGPLITTVNDMVAIVTYYGMSWLLLVKLLPII